LVLSLLQAWCFCTIISRPRVSTAPRIPFGSLFVAALVLLVLVEHQGPALLGDTAAWERRKPRRRGGLSVMAPCQAYRMLL
jgi:hypothetical protein